MSNKEIQRLFDWLADNLPDIPLFFDGKLGGVQNCIIDDGSFKFSNARATAIFDRHQIQPQALPPDNNQE
ncbi:hypothetical protein AFK24_24970 [Pseudomonas syringae]|uniref:Uncharacterized protein n=1 Tax=Pseudomonas syringae TaxID=317 RepID=A0A1C7YYP0_PSESX|nr:hypothetical protein [Pseudomonas syringae]OCR22359.1 hypothetical protein AFK24_24970 [Pseudomonas syringae]